MTAHTIKLTIILDSSDFELLCDLMNCREYVDNSTYENALVNNLLNKIVDLYREQTQETLNI